MGPKMVLGLGLRQGLLQLQVPGLVLGLGLVLVPGQGLVPAPALVLESVL